MKVLFCYPGLVDGFDSYHNGSDWLNHGVAILSAVLKKAGHQVEYLDLRKLRDWKEVDRAISESDFDVFLISVCSVDFVHAVRLAKIVKGAKTNIPVIVGGVHPTLALEECFAIKEFDYIITHEAEILLPSLLYGIGEKMPVYKVNQGIMPENLDKVPFADRSLQPEGETPFHGCFQKPFFSITASRGCPGRCLTGDTIIHTTDGVFPIKDIVGKEGVKVLTRNPTTQEPVYAPAIHIRKTQEMAELIRVFFTDGSHIDCTPDHKFKVFKSKNQYINESEWDVEAKDLIPKQQVRAVRLELNKNRLSVSTRRDIVRAHCQVLMQGQIGRRLEKSERVHHLDKNQSNDVSSNLVLTDKHSHITDHHPEVSHRMKENNPTKNMTDDWRKNISISGTGKTRTLEQRIRYRESKLGDKNPMYKDNPKRRRSYSSRIPDVNHRVLRVEKLSHREDVYCMEVPGINWFYANNVLVHNCSFCQPSERAVFGNKIRKRSVDNIISELEQLATMYGMKSFMIHDDCFVTFPEWVKEFCEKKLASPVLKNLTFGCQARADMVCRGIDMMTKLHEAGLRLVLVGFESGSDRVLQYLKKGVTVEQNIRAAKILKEIGINVQANIMLGIPTETREEMRQTRDMVEEMKPYRKSIASYTPVPGSELYEFCKDNGLILMDGWRTHRRTAYSGRKLKGVPYFWANFYSAQMEVGKWKAPAFLVMTYLINMMQETKIYQVLSLAWRRHLRRRRD